MSRGRDGGMLRVLVVGGYGSVGAEVCRLLAKEGSLEVFVGGRNRAKAEQLARELSISARLIDVSDTESYATGLDGIDIVVNCFVDLLEPSLDLPKAATSRGIHFLDVAAVPVEYVESLLALGGEARATGATVVTSLGVNPGIPGLLAMSEGRRFDRVESVDIYFTMGGRMEGLSPLSLRGVDLMLKTAPMQWRREEWCEASPRGKKRFIGAPFDKEVYFGAGMITADLHDVPKSIGAEHLSLWSGMESSFQGLVFILGMKLAFARTQRRAENFLRVLQWLGRGGDTTNDIGLELELVGEKDGQRMRRLVSLHCSEEYATGLPPAILCRQLARGLVTARGAFVPHQVAAIDDFVVQLRGAGVNLDERWEVHDA